MENTIRHVLHQARQFSLNAITDNFLETDLLLAHSLNVTRSYLYTYPERKLTSSEYKRFISYFERQQQGEPIAYITGHREFWSLTLEVTPDTLIPRQETELLVELALHYAPVDVKTTIADLGTGAGPIALALAHEKPDWVIFATDLCEDALQVAKKNAAHFNLKNIIFCHGDWLNALPVIKFDMIISNPPYLSEEDSHLTQRSLAYEPPNALISGREGLDAIFTIIHGAQCYLNSGGYLLIEHGFQQAKKVQSIFAEVGYNEITTVQDLSRQERVTIGKWR